jgi:hypothetical protein
MGVAVIGIKHRTRAPHILPNDGIQALTSVDAKRAMRDGLRALFMESALLAKF